jgi:hypothetical protein
MGLDISSCKYYWVGAGVFGHFTYCAGFRCCGQALSLSERYPDWCFSVGLDIPGNLKLGRIENKLEMILLKIYSAKNENNFLDAD